MRIILNYDDVNEDDNSKFISLLAWSITLVCIICICIIYCWYYWLINERMCVHIDINNDIAVPLATIVITDVPEQRYSFPFALESLYPQDDVVVRQEPTDYDNTHLDFHTGFRIPFAINEPQ